ncbi:hypothetical protein [Hymenobacter sp. CRA2]|uniref:hypothetical protein n=1 Tax=Hymenobacter sp. CRA2 TaxID=1955620 RepID=UPI00098F827B|nr:hypothetical protein [Hymenobacter sp. CRA2]OON68503.1 hypothetical protein B0919_12725 [Hymenobacter sp. CRA2]
MNTFVRPAKTSVQTQPQAATTSAQLPEYPYAAATPAPQPARPLPDEEDEKDAQTKRDFYAWCSGCEGFGSIF